MIDFSYTFAGALTGVFIGLTGVGGGALMTPILLLFFGVSPITAIATDLWFASITKIVGARIHQAAGNVDWLIVKRLWCGSLPIALLVVLLINFNIYISNVDWLTEAIGFLVLVTAIGLLLAPKLKQIARNYRLKKATCFKSIQPALTVISGGILGICVALTSVGAGALGSVTLLFLYPLRMVPHRLVATDIVHAIPLAVVAGIGYLFAGKVDGWMLISLLIGSIPAVLIGSILAGKCSPRVIQFLLSFVLITAAYKLLA
ncbi:sulfite exporter TauE/SafE family protein [Xenorhabdus sp. SGI246]|uniref:sulfite exporter TauE/SafE family protein n=1 Tax=Xenorhabdus sp. SGI246 TaxID=3158263 RepID=UPI00349F71F5